MHDNVWQRKRRTGFRGALISVLALGLCARASAAQSVSSVTVAPTTAALYGPGSTSLLHATVLSRDGSVLVRSITWRSSDTMVAKVSTAGLVTAFGNGSTTITASTSNKRARATVTVSGFTPPPVVQQPVTVAPTTTTTTTSTSTTPTTSTTTPTTSTTGFLPGNILDNGSFETTWEYFNNGAAVAPTGVVRDVTHAWSPGNIDVPGQRSVRRSMPVTSGSDNGASMMWTFDRGNVSPWNLPVTPQTADRIYGRFCFYFDAAVTGVNKFQIYESTITSDQFGGFYLWGGRIGWAFIKEWQSQIHPIISLSGLVGAWHCLESDYWRNGDPSGYPSVAIWLDGVQLTAGLNSPPAPGAWVGGRLNAGQRGSTLGVGTFNLVGVLNGNPNNTVAGNVWVDHVSISTAGRVGP